MAGTVTVTCNRVNGTLQSLGNPILSGEPCACVGYTVVCGEPYNVLRSLNCVEKPVVCRESFSVGKLCSAWRRM
jgi:hypothetical protein